MPTIDVSNFYSSPPPRPVVPGGVVPPPPGGSGQGGGALAGVKSFWSKLPTWGKVLVVIGAIVVIWVIWHSSGSLFGSSSGGSTGSSGGSTGGSGGSTGGSGGSTGGSGGSTGGSGGSGGSGGGSGGSGGTLSFGGPGSTEQPIGSPTVDNTPTPTPSAAHHQSTSNDILGTGKTAAQFAQAHPTSAGQVVMPKGYHNSTQHAAGVKTGAPQIRAIPRQMSGSHKAVSHPKANPNPYHPRNASYPKGYPYDSTKAKNPKGYPYSTGTQGHPGVRR